MATYQGLGFTLIEEEVENRRGHLEKEKENCEIMIRGLDGSYGFYQWKYNMRDDPDLSELLSKEQKKRRLISDPHGKHSADQLEKCEIELEQVQNEMRKIFKKHCQKTIYKHNKKIQEIEPELQLINNAFSAMNTGAQGKEDATLTEEVQLQYIQKYKKKAEYFNMLKADVLKEIKKKTEDLEDYKSELQNEERLEREIGRRPDGEYLFGRVQITEAAIAKLSQEKLSKYDSELLLLASLIAALEIVVNVTNEGHAHLTGEKRKRFEESIKYLRKKEAKALELIDTHKEDESFYKSVLLVPSTAEWRRDELKAKLKDSGENIQKWEHNIASYGRQIKQVQSALDPTKKKIPSLPPVPSNTDPPISLLESTEDHDGSAVTSSFKATDERMLLDKSKERVEELKILKAQCQDGISMNEKWISESQNFTMSWDLKPAYVTKRLCIYEEGIKIQKQAVADCEREMQQISTSCGTVVENKGPLSPSDSLPDGSLSPIPLERSSASLSGSCPLIPPKPKKRSGAASASLSGSRPLIPPKPRPRSEIQLECSSAIKPRPVPKPRKRRVKPELQEDPKLPGVLLSELPRREIVTSKGTEIDLKNEIGVSISIPEDSTRKEQSLDLATGFSGVYEMPNGVQSVSPAYLIKTTEEVTFRKDVDVTLQHNANLETMEDCKEMIFLGANLTPTQRDSDSNPVYKFEEIKGSPVEFSPGKMHGGITLSRLFSLFKIGRKQGDKKKEKFYSARLYKALMGHSVTAVFCMCPDHPTYAKFCDKVILEEHPEISCNKKATKKTIKNALIITASEVELLLEKNTWTIDMDKTTISRMEVDSPERLKIKLCKLADYPPRIVINLSPTQKSSHPAVLKVKGLKSEYSFKIAPSSHSLPKVDTELLKDRREVFEAEIAAARAIARAQAKSIDQVPDSPMVRCAKNMVEMVTEIEQNIHDPTSMTILVTKVGEIQDLIETVVKLARGAKNVEDSVIQVSMVSHQLKMVAPAMYKCAAGDPESWSGAVDVLVGNAINLMKYISDLLKDTEIASIGHGENLQYKARAVPTIHDMLSPVIKPDGSRYDLSSKISGSWEDIGLRLGLEYNMLHGEIEELRTAKSRLGAVLAIWFEDAPQLPNYGKYPISWEGLHNLLCDADHSVAAKEFVDFMTES